MRVELQRNINLELQSWFGFRNIQKTYIFTCRKVQLDMEYLAGMLLAVLTAGFAKILGFDKDRSFYPVLLFVIAIFYVLFAVISENTEVIVKESLVAVVFLVVAIVGSRVSFPLIGIGLVAHGGFDVLHDQFNINAAVPLWWPGFCAAVDVVLGMWILYMYRIRSNKSLQPTAESGG